MTTAESLFRNLGALELPITGSDTSLGDLDPARDILLGLLKEAIIGELEDRWAYVVPGTAYAAVAPVADAIPLEPSPNLMQQRKALFPLLCVYRNDAEATIDDWTLASIRLTQKWGVDYILGPLDAGDERKLRDVLIAVAKIIALTLRAGGHAAYQTNDDGQPSLVLGAEGAGFVIVKITGFQMGVANFGGRDSASPRYHAMSMTLETVEVDDMNESANTEYGGMSMALGTGNGDGDVLYDALDP